MLAQLPLLHSSGNEVSSREKGLSGFLWETISGSIGKKSRQSAFRSRSPTHASRLHLGKVTSFCKEKIFGDTRGVQVLPRGVKPCVRPWRLNKSYYNTIELVTLNSLAVNLIFLILQMSGEMGQICETDGSGTSQPCEGFSLRSWVDCKKARFLVQATPGPVSHCTSWSSTSSCVYNWKRVELEAPRAVFCSGLIWSVCVP